MNTAIKSHKHLKLVHDGRTQNGSPQQLQKFAYQLSLPLNNYNNLLIFAREADVAGPTFFDFLNRIKPLWLFDIRNSPRLDIFASSRSSAFDFFDALDTRYVDVFNQLDLTDQFSTERNPCFWGESITSLIKEEKNSGPYVFLFDDDQMFNASQEVIPALFRPIIKGEKPELSVFSQ